MNRINCWLVYYLSDPKTTHVSCIIRLHCSEVAMFLDINSYFVEYNVIITNEAYENNTTDLISWNDLLW